MNSLLSHRVEWYSFELLNADMSLKEKLLARRGSGSMTFSTSNEIRGIGSFVCDGRQAKGVKWGRSLVRVTYHQQGQPDRIMLTGIPGVGDDSYSATFDWAQVQLYDRTLALRDDPIGEYYGLPSGTDCIAKVLELISSVGDLPVLIPVPVVPALLTVAKSWNPNDTKLLIVNDLLKAAGYADIYADELGRLRSEPIVDPMVRPVVWPFENSRESVMTPDWKRGRDLLAVPNRIRMIRATEGAQPADVAVAVNEDPNSDFSYQNRANRWVTKVVTGVTANSFAVLQQLAKQELTKLSQAASTFDLEHPVLPIRAGEVATLRHTKLDGQLFRIAAQDLAYTCAAGRMVQGTYQEVVNVTAA